MSEAYLFTTSGTGPYFYDKKEIDNYIETLRSRVAELETRLREKPAYHCPKCDSWFGEDELEALLEQTK